MEKSNEKLAYDKPGGKKLSNASNNYDLSIGGEKAKNSKNNANNSIADNEDFLTNETEDSREVKNDPDLVERGKSSDRLSGRDNTLPKGDRFDDKK